MNRDNVEESNNMSGNTFFCSQYMTKKFEDDTQKKYEKESDLKIEYVDHGIVHPLEISHTGRAEDRQYGGVTDKNFNFIELSLNRRSKGENYVPFYDWYIGANPNNKNIKYLDEEVVFIGPIKQGLSHFYLETVSRFWFFLNEDNLKYKIAFLSRSDDYPDFELIDFFFSGLNIKKENLLEIKEPTQFRTVIVPEQSFELHLSYHKQYKDIFDKLKSNVPPAPYEKVYFAKFPWRSVGEELIVEICKKNGYRDCK
jgi:hypothetical protein